MAIWLGVPSSARSKRPMAVDAKDSANLAQLTRAGLAILKQLLPSIDGWEPVGIEFAEPIDKAALSKPFAGFENFQACVTEQTGKGHSDESARKICGALQAQTEKVEPEELTKSVIRLIKTIEERYVLGIVLEPTLEMNEADSQGDVYSAEEVRKAAYGYMENQGILGIQHKEAADGKIKILESWVQRGDTTIEGQPVKDGTWLLGVRVVDDDLWQAVKDGKFTGFSIGGVANRTPIGE